MLLDKHSSCINLRKKDFKFHLQSFINVLLMTNIKCYTLILYHFYAGSDEERALVKAIEASFYEVKLVHCTLHLKKNLRSFLLKKSGFSSKAAAELKEKIFDEKEGLLSATSEEEFSMLMESLSQEYGDLFKGGYMKSFMKRIYNHVLYPNLSTNGRLKMNFTTNDQEVNMSLEWVLFAS